MHPGTSFAITSARTGALQRVSHITSSPLFMSVALSTVIFRPMLQLGCLSASATWDMQAGSYGINPQ